MPLSNTWRNHPPRLILRVDIAAASISSYQRSAGIAIPLVRADCGGRLRRRRAAGPHDTGGEHVHRVLRKPVWMCRPYQLRVERPRSPCVREQPGRPVGTGVSERLTARPARRDECRWSLRASLFDAQTAVNCLCRGARSRRPGWSEVSCMSAALALLAGVSDKDAIDGCAISAVAQLPAYAGRSR